MTSGEKRLGDRLEQKLDDDYLIWYDIPIGKKQLRPDFTILHPLRGLLILEVKDWNPETIIQINRSTVTLQLEGEPKQVKNPLEQARGYLIYAANLLQRDRALLDTKGQLNFAYGYGVVLTNITRQTFHQSRMDEVLPPHLVICKDEMVERIDEEEFQKRLWDMFPYPMNRMLSTQEIHRLRYHLYPDIAIQHHLFPEATEEEIKPIDISMDLIRVMDLQQEQLARSLGEGHRVVHGVAGSGKTLLLAYRCEFLAEQKLDKPILVLCFNVTLANRLQQIIAEKGIENRVIVRYFHGWCSEQARIYRLPTNRDLKGEQYIDHLVNTVILAADKGIVPSAQYSAVMVDEGHDFSPEWYKLLVQMVDPATDSLLVLYDDAQNLYRKRKPKFTSKSVGIKASGRTTILKMNYRNTVEVLSLAYEFAKSVLESGESEQEDGPIYVQPESSGRHGHRPVFVKLPKFRNEIEFLIGQCHKLHQNGVRWGDMAVLYRSKFMGEETYDQLTKACIPVSWLNRDSNSRFQSFRDDTVKLLTMHASKGLEFPVVFIIGLGFMPNTYSTPAEDARLLYVAMTRSTDRLYLTGDRDSDFVKQISQVLQPSPEQLSTNQAAQELLSLGLPK
jgi:superfamily I DNA/RNA helicase